MSEKYGFKRKSIAKVLKKKINNWLASIDDDVVRKAARNDVIVTGGSITSMLMGEPINDFDLYFKTKETTTLVAEYYCKKFIEQNPNSFYGMPIVKHESLINIKGDLEERVTIHACSSGILESEDSETTEEFGYEEEYFEGVGDEVKTEDEEEPSDMKEKLKYRPVFLSQNAITLTNKIQIVIRFYGLPEEIHKNYDFEHCKHVWDHRNNELYLNQAGLEAILSKTLIYTGSLYPICSLFRTRKFINRGWRISAGELLKMAWQISEINLNDPVTIKEQLTGCDMNYMRALIKVMEEDREKLIGTEFNSQYIVELIDRIFNE